MYINNFLNNTVYVMYGLQLFSIHIMMINNCECLSFVRQFVRTTSYVRQYDSVEKCRRVTNCLTKMMIQNVAEMVRHLQTSLPKSKKTDGSAPELEPKELKA